LVAAPHTPFRPDGSLALDVIPQQVKLLVRNGVRGAFICGTTGEGASLSTPERRAVAEAWRAATPASLALIVHVGHLSAAESRGLARHAAEIEADAIATVAPSFFRPSRAVDLAGWCADVAGAAPELPFYYYHMPAMTGVTISAAAFLAEAGPRIPNLAGIKFTHEDLMDYATAAQVADRRYEILFGRDEILLAGLALGATGAVGSTYNFAAPLYHRIMRAFAAGKLAAARKEQERSMEFVQIMNRYGGLPANKAMMKLAGVDCGPVRAPLPRLDRDAEKKLCADLRRVGFSAYASKP